jgi:S-adenosyl methyltransferase
MNADPLRLRRPEAAQGDDIPEFDPSKPRSARLHDFWLGGKDNFAADRAAGADALEVYPDIASSARATRAFLVRAVRFLAAREGVRQFLDIGTGLPAAGSANTHEVALAVSPQCRVLYMDNDPAVGNQAPSSGSSPGWTSCRPAWSARRSGGPTRRKRPPARRPPGSASRAKGQGQMLEICPNDPV